MTNNDLVRRYRFFRRQTLQAQTALALAKAEAWLDEQEDIVAMTGPDWDIDDSWMSDEERRQPHTWEVYRLVRVCEDHGADCRHAETLASVGGVVDADAAYARVLFAELASEVIGR